MKPLRLLPLLLFLCVPASAALKPGAFVTEGPPHVKRIALTFDDGPGPHTQEYLDLLDRYHVKATFFMLAEQVQYRKKLAAEVLAKGHEVGSHTYNHENYLLVYRKNAKKYPATDDGKAKAAADSKAALIADMKKSRTITEAAIGSKLTILRMPHGVDRPWVKDAAREAGFVLVNWTFGEDWLPKTEPELEHDYIKALKPGAIFLLHDGGTKREKSLQATEALIKAAQAQGYEMVTVSELIGNR
jgi:peptidoglycan/xylan/chitin deacetylase (PgdA/CDA1 family)